MCASPAEEVELIEAMPVLIPVADPKPITCDEGQRYVAVLNWHFGEDRTDPADRRLRRGARA